MWSGDQSSQLGFFFFFFFFFFYRTQNQFHSTTACFRPYLHSLRLQKQQLQLYHHYSTPLTIGNTFIFHYYISYCSYICSICFFETGHSTTVCQHSCLQMYTIFLSVYTCFTSRLDQSLLRSQPFTVNWCGPSTRKNVVYQWKRSIPTQMELLCIPLTQTTVSQSKQPKKCNNMAWFSPN